MQSIECLPIQLTTTRSSGQVGDLILSQSGILAIPSRRDPSRPGNAALELREILFALHGVHRYAYRSLSVATLRGFDSPWQGNGRSCPHAARLL